MKTIEQLYAQDAVYLNDWKESGLKGLIDDFELQSSPSLIGKKVLFASYSYENYSGDAWVLVSDEVNLFEVNGSHCSCYGLENQWELEPVELKELQNRVVNGSFGTDDYCGNEFKKELITFLGLEVTNG